MRERRGRVTEVTGIAPRVTLVTIASDEPAELVVKAGQFLSIRVPDGGRRSYSIVSRSGRATRVKLLLKSTVAGGGTRAMADGLEVGATVRFFGPMGYFLFDPSHDGDVVFGATGIGITAILPMIEEAIASPAGRIELLWGLREPEDLVLADRLTEVASSDRFSFRVLYSGRGDGYINSHVVATVAAMTRPRVYLCGHGAMIQDVAAGVDDDVVIHTEVFYPAPTLPETRGEERQ